MNLKFWTWFKKEEIPTIKQEDLARSVKKPKGDFFKSTVKAFTPRPVARKIKRRQRAKRGGLSKVEWERKNGKKWANV